MILATTTVTLAEVPADVDPYDAVDPTEVATKLPAHISSPVGIETLLGGNRDSIDARLHLDPTPALNTRHTVTDDVTGDAYRVVWVQRRTGLGLDHQIAGLRRVEGAAGG